MIFKSNSIFSKYFKKKKSSIDVPTLIEESNDDISKVSVNDIESVDEVVIVNEDQIEEIEIVEPVKVVTVKELFEEALSVNFKKTETGDGMYTSIYFYNEDIKQQFLIFITTNGMSTSPVKVIPIIPSGKELLGYSDKNPLQRPISYDVEEDKENPGEVYLSTIRMKRIISKYKHIEEWSVEDVKEYVQEIADWTSKTNDLRKIAINRKSTKEKSQKNEIINRFNYSISNCKRCDEIIISNRANASMTAEALSRDPNETGGILLGRYKNGKWYVVEATDPGLDIFLSTHHLEMDVKYHNHIYPVLSRLYKQDLWLLGLWHRHPNNLTTFSKDDNRTNLKYAEAIGNGTLSFLINFVPEIQITCYYFDEKGTQSYYLPNVKIGDEYFHGTDFLTHANEEILTSRKKQMQIEINYNNTVSDLNY